MLCLTEGRWSKLNSANWDHSRLWRYQATSLLKTTVECKEFPIIGKCRYLQRHISVP